MPGLLVDLYHNQGSAVRFLVLSMFISDTTEGQSGCFILGATVGHIKSSVSGSFM